MVPASPFLLWLDSQRRSNWTLWLTDTQTRYIERIMKNRPAHLNVHSVDAILWALGREELLSYLYPD
jgi:hypothetical protein